MAKTKSTFVCQSCGTTHPKWVGKCNGCGEWNTVVEEILEREDKPFNYKSGKQSKAATPSLKPLKEVEAGEQSRLLTPDAELNRVLGGGIVPGSLVLVAGEPGIGKSTLFLQLALQLNSRTVVYVSG